MWLLGIPVALQCVRPGAAGHLVVLLVLVAEQGTKFFISLWRVPRRCGFAAWSIQLERRLSPGILARLRCDMNHHGAIWDCCTAAIFAPRPDSRRSNAVVNACKPARNRSSVT